MTTDLSYDIRTATAADLDAVDRLLVRSYPQLLKADYAPSVMVTALPIIARAQPELLRSGTYYLAEHDTDVVAAGGWTQSAPGGRPGQRGLGHIRHVATDPAHTRRGLGRALMDHIKLTARASGMMQLHCQSTLTAEPFYAAQGFVKQADVDVLLRPGINFPAVFMVLHL